MLYNLIGIFSSSIFLLSSWLICNFFLITLSMEFVFRTFPLSGHS
jgi:hypothetical protein